ncbi:probable disease resistance protein At4g27220 [Lycium ferocissimum]|uniref:probable disease resistance protein At4g27220 n=1 Tax=Lycium ferocissimum TaxID=112874 RepID=UPI002815AF3D|nr:probable disease resistance protein At4g27220 [Lycium ferocissimum]
MDLLSNVMGKVAGFLFQPVRQEIGYLSYHDDNVKSLKTESQRPKHIISGLKRREEAEKRNLHAISPCSRCLWSKRSKEISLDVIELQTEGKDYDKFSDPEPSAVEIEAIPSDSGEEFDSRKLKEEEGEIAREVGLTLEGDNLLNRGDRLRSRLTAEESVLVILDDVWETLDLKKLGIPSGSNHNHRYGGSKEHGSWNLIEEEAWILFRQIAGNSVNAPSLHRTAKYAAIECKGLPLAIITVAGTLKHKSKSSWEDALVQLQRSAPKNIPGVIKNVYQSLRLSYDYFKSDEIRYRFLFCSLFEEDSDIWHEQLLRYGIGLSIFSETENLEESRKRVSHLLETLRDRFLLFQGSDENHVKIRDVIRDVVIYIASEGKHIFMLSHDVNSEAFPRRTSYEPYSHLLIVAEKFDELPKPIVSPGLEFLIIKPSQKPNCRMISLLE